MSYESDEGSFRGRSFGGFGGQGEVGPRPVEVGKEYDVDITELSRRGDGIAKVQGFVIFVPGAKAGQKAKIKVTSVGPRHAVGEMVTGQEATAESASSTEETEQ